MLSLYRQFLSPLLHSLLAPLTGSTNACRFSPTCSVYFHQSVRNYGIICGSLKGFWRLLRCNPLFKGGHDPV